MLALNRTSFVKLLELIFYFESIFVNKILISIKLFLSTRYISYKFMRSKVFRFARFHHHTTLPIIFVIVHDHQIATSNNILSNRIVG